MTQRLGARGAEERGSDRRQLLHTVSGWQCHTWQLSITALPNTSLPDIAGAAAKHALSGVIHPHMSTGSLRLHSSCHCKSETEGGERGRGERGRGEREGSIHLFTYGKVTNSLQALC